MEAHTKSALGVERDVVVRRAVDRQQVGHLGIGHLPAEEDATGAIGEGRLVIARAHHTQHHLVADCDRRRRAVHAQALAQMSHLDHHLILTQLHRLAAGQVARPHARRDDGAALASAHHHAAVLVDHGRRVIGRGEAHLGAHGRASTVLHLEARTVRQQHHTARHQPERRKHVDALRATAHLAAVAAVHASREATASDRVAAHRVEVRRSGHCRHLDVVGVGVQCHVAESALRRVERPAPVVVEHQLQRHLAAQRHQVGDAHLHRGHGADVHQRRGGLPAGQTHVRHGDAQRGRHQRGDLERARLLAVGVVGGRSGRGGTRRSRQDLGRRRVGQHRRDGRGQRRSRGGVGRKVVVPGAAGHVEATAVARVRQQRETAREQLHAIQHGHHVGAIQRVGRHQRVRGRLGAEHVSRAQHRRPVGLGRHAQTQLALEVERTELYLVREHQLLGRGCAGALLVEQRAQRGQSLVAARVAQRQAGDVVKARTALVQRGGVEQHGAAVVGVGAHASRSRRELEQRQGVRAGRCGRIGEHRARTRRIGGEQPERGRHLAAHRDQHALGGRHWVGCGGMVTDTRPQPRCAVLQAHDPVAVACIAGQQRSQVVYA
mmetsp:Transcript_15356/g.45940  ORF Transcript_15356/g.45940 Transcript_15356/m.45940 type:complete len:605 (+) Transcript_15356:1730-3544(+)